MGWARHRDPASTPYIGMYWRKRGGSSETTPHGVGAGRSSSKSAIYGQEGELSKATFLHACYITPYMGIHGKRKGGVSVATPCMGGARQGVSAGIPCMGKKRQFNNHVLYEWEKEASFRNHHPYRQKKEEFQQGYPVNPEELEWHPLE